MRTWLLLLLSLVLTSIPDRAFAGHLSLTETSPAEFVFFDDSVRELSGLSWRGGDQFLAVEDKESSVVALTIDVDPTTGIILSATTGTKLQLRDPTSTPLPTTYDQEGIAFDAARSQVWVSNESEPGIRRHDLVTGVELDGITPGGVGEFDVYSNVRGNLGFEALTAREDGGAVWTANEEFLAGDPDPTIRLQRLDAELAPSGQWAYDVDPDPITFLQTLANGVSDMMVVPDGTLVVMERAFGASAAGGVESRIRLYEVDLATATQLAGATVDGSTLRVGKQLLFERSFNLIQDNFEGIALGPMLANGDRSVILIADNGSDTTGVHTHSLFALRLAGGAVPEPGALGLLVTGVLGIALRRTRAR